MPREKAAASETWVLEQNFSRRGQALDPNGIPQYLFVLEAGQFLELEIEQEGTDLQVDVWQEDGEQVLHIDSPNGSRGAEPVVLAPARDTRYRLTVKTFEPQQEPAGFTAKVKHLRPTTETDRQAARAWQELSAAEIARKPPPGRDPPIPVDVEGVAEKYQNAARIWEKLGDFPLASRAETLRGSLLLGNAETRKDAAEAFTKALALAEATRDPSRIGHGLHQLGRALMELDQLESAEPILERALEIWRKERNRREEGILINDLALLSERQGQIHLAIELYTQSVEIWQSLAIRPFEATARTNLGTLYQGVGDRRQAIIHYRRSLKLLEGLRPNSRRAWIEVRLGDALLGLEGPDTALENYRRALSIYREQRDAGGEAFALNSIGLAEREAQRPKPAIEALRHSLSIYRQLGQLREACATATNLATALEDLGLLQQARELFQDALGWARQTGISRTEVECLFGLARIDRKHPPAAIGHLAAALEILEMQRMQPSQSAQRASFLEIRLGIYELMVEMLVESEEAKNLPQRSFAAAFEVVERSRARGFLDSLRRAPRKEGGDAQLEAKIIDLAQEIDRLHLRRWMSQDVHHPSSTPFDEAITLTLGRYHQLEAELFDLDRKPAPQPDLESVREDLLAPGTLLLAYYLAKDRSFVWSIRQSGVKMHQLPPRTQIEATVHELATLLKRPADPLEHGARQLALLEASRQLLSPVADEIETATRLIVVPSGSLKGLSFAALPNPGKPSEPLVARYEISYMPSVAALAELQRQAGHSRGEGLAILADPVTSPSDERFGEVAPQSGGVSLPRLEYSSREGRLIAGSAPSGPVLWASGFGAERELLLSGRLSGFRFLHFAGHGFEDQEWPELSSLLVSAYSDDGKVQDGFLRAYEIRRLHLSAELVTLSACETASPGTSGAEGMFGLSRSFFDAGAQHVLMSLWPVHDAATAELMSRFYAHLFEGGETPSRAFQLALKQALTVRF